MKEKTMKYKIDFEGKLVWVDRIKSFIEASEENKEILFKFVKNIFENDVTDKASEPKSNSTNVKRKGRPRKTI